MHIATADYLSGLAVTQGALVGQPLRVLPWQRRFLRGALAPGVYESALTMARGGGKSTFTAALACAAIDGPLAQPNSEVLIVAASLRQGSIIHRHASRFLAGKKLKVYDSPNRQAIYNPGNGVLLEVKGANPATIHGLAPSLIICDELAQWPPNRVDAMLSALDTSLGKIPDGRIWKIGTRPASGEHPFEVALKSADYTQVHAARPGDPPFQRRTWQRACPSLRYFPDLEAKIRNEAKKAKANPELLAAFRALRLNLGVSDTLANDLISVEAWRAAEGSVPIDGPCVWGIDLGGTAASSAVAAYWPASGRLDALAAFPGATMGLKARGLRDGVGGLYVSMQKRGELLVTGDHTVDPRTLLREALARFGRPVAVAADRWREGELRDALQGAGIPAASLSLRGQGYKDGAEDVRLFQRAIIDQRARPVQSLLMRSAMAEARTVTDPAGNSKLAKGSQGQRRARARDDAAAAAILAVAEGERRGRTPGRKMRVAVVG